MSAILLNDDYYTMLQNGRMEIDRVTVLAPEYLVPFKAKAFLDLSERKAAGQAVDSADIKKLKNDVARLVSIMTGRETVKMPDAVRADMSQFIAEYEQNPVEPKRLNLQGLTSAGIVTLLKQIYMA